MDTHGTAAVGYDRLPAAGVALTVESGLYLPPDTVRFGRFTGSGVRVEDDVVVGHQSPAGGAVGRRARGCARAGGTH